MSYTYRTDLLRCAVRSVNNEINRLRWMEQAYDKAAEAIIAYAQSGTRDDEIYQSLVARREELKQQRLLAEELVGYFSTDLSDKLKIEYAERTASDWVPEPKEE